jgi:hypothetical protein
MPLFPPTQQSTTWEMGHFGNRLKLDITPPRDHAYEPDRASYVHANVSWINLSTFF